MMIVDENALVSASVIDSLIPLTLHLSPVLLFIQHQTSGPPHCDPTEKRWSTLFFLDQSASTENGKELTDGSFIQCGDISILRSLKRLTASLFSCSFSRVS